MENKKIVITAKTNEEKEFLNELLLDATTEEEKDNFLFISQNDVEDDNILNLSNKSLDKILKEQSNIKINDIIIHIEYGLGQFLGFETITLNEIQNDFIKLQYSNSSLLLPIENIDLITKYSDYNPHIKLDNLGGHGWSERKQKAKEKIKAIAEDLIRIASERQLLKATKIYKNEGEYEYFSSLCGFKETTDQLKAIDDIEEDFKKGSPMDRLLCGDVGFGKTEVAIRSAFMVVMNKN